MFLEFVLFFLFLVLFKIKTTSEILIILGSGGHTTEMFKYLPKLETVPKVYVIADSDLHSENKLKEYETDYKLYKIPRSRSVKQSWFTTPFTFLYSLAYSFYLVYTVKPCLIICNGPGTCVPMYF
jgi:beta-1,4-N-acetylglucosaminyltransferase